MLRVIAGEMRSRKLRAPEGMDTRPTADRVKEALFSILGARMYGARVLDLYAGSGALALGAELMERLGPDSPAGRTAAVMLGSTETTFYTVSVYFAAAGIHRTRHAIPAALVSDLVGFLCAGIFVRLFFGS